MFHIRKQLGWILAAIILTTFTAACGSDSKTTDAPAQQTDTPNASIMPTAVFATATPAAATPASPTVLLEEKDAITTESGLQYVDVVVGEGPKPQLGDIIVMNMIGYLPDGTIFYNSYELGEPIVAIYGQDPLLPGWEEGVGMMNSGGTSKLGLPSELAFGEQGAGVVPPNSPIVLEVQLVSSSPAPEPAAVSEDQLTATDSGLQYYDIESGKGEQAAENSIVSTHYKIWVKVDDDTNQLIVSSEMSQPISFVVGRGDMVFPGWEEGTTGMKVGGVRLLVVPPELALGETGGGSIPPNATLIMELELLDVTQPPKITEVDEGDYITTESGLKYYDLVEGSGASPAVGQQVSVHYTGWLQDGGTQFDSSIERGTPFVFQLGAGNVIQGWDEGVASMKVGGKRQLVIPPELGYGDSGAGSVIPPGATLIFEVELLEILE